VPDVADPVAPFAQTALMAAPLNASPDAAVPIKAKFATGVVTVVVELLPPPQEEINKTDTRINILTFIHIKILPVESESLQIVCQNELKKYSD
jgi:hypothetical protein